jgi:CRISPR-associated protein Cmr4
MVMGKLLSLKQRLFHKKGLIMVNLLSIIRTLSPLHCGVGVGMNDIEAPVIRHKVSGHPVIPGSSMKGVLREEYFLMDDKTKEDVEALFGPDSADQNSFASAISVGDAILLALPVRSFYGTFAHLASPYTLQQFKASLMRASFNNNLPIPLHLGLEAANDNYRVMITTNSFLQYQQDNKSILLEELDLIIDSANADDWAKIIADLFYETEEEKNLFKRRFAIVDDNALNFLCETSLPVNAHIRINEETGTVDNGALWYEETVPAETLFASTTGVDRSYKNGCKKDAASLAGILCTQDNRREIFTQFGGKSTTGKGLVSVRFVKGGITC